jgi:hypothetical protein
MSASTPDPRSLSSYHARLPYGERVSPEPLVGQPFFPFEGDGLTVVPLDEPIVPEPPRGGEPGGEECFRCANPDANVVWRDDHWEVRAGFERPGLPIVAGLNSRAHITLRTMPNDLAATLGPMIRRLAMAIERIDSVARCHFNRWGDGSAHFHMWFLARPLGMMQLRGAMIAAWDELLPRVPDDELAANIRTVAAAMAEGGGEAIGAGAA